MVAVVNQQNIFLRLLMNQKIWQEIKFFLLHFILREFIYLLFIVWLGYRQDSI
jgi:hypothetical protein